MKKGLGYTDGVCGGDKPTTDGKIGTKKEYTVLLGGMRRIGMKGQKSCVESKSFKYTLKESIACSGVDVVYDKSVR